MQIGPRIRVGGTLGQIGEGIKHVASAALPIAAIALPVLGPVLGAISHIPGVSEVVSKLGDGVEAAVSKIPGGSALLDAVKSGAAKAEDVGNFIAQHKDTLLQAANVANAAALQGKSDKYATDAYDSAKSAYDAKAPLRVAGQAGMLNPQTADLSGLKQLAGAGSGNPFARSMSGPLPVAGGPMPGMPPGMPPAPSPLSVSPSPMAPSPVPSPMPSPLPIAPMGPKPLAGLPRPQMPGPLPVAGQPQPSIRQAL